MATPEPETKVANPPKVEVVAEPTPKDLVKPDGYDKPGDSTTEQARYYWNLFVSYLSKLPDYLGQFFGENQKPITIVVLIVAAFVSLKATLAAIDAINDIPLLSPLFELIGIGYSAWFVYRYLLRASTRQELTSEIKNLKEQVIGNGK